MRFFKKFPHRKFHIVNELHFTNDKIIVIKLGLGLILFQLIDTINTKIQHDASLQMLREYAENIKKMIRKLDIWLS